MDPEDERMPGPVLPAAGPWRSGPGRLVVGMGCRSGVGADHLRELLHRTLAMARLDVAGVEAVVTHESKAQEQGLLDLCRQLGIPLLTHSPQELAPQPVMAPSQTVQATMGTPSVAEAAVLAHGAELVVGKQKSSGATCAVGRLG